MNSFLQRLNIMAAKDTPEVKINWDCENNTYSIDQPSQDRTHEKTQKTAQPKQKGLLEKWLEPVEQLPIKIQYDIEQGGGYLGQKPMYQDPYNYHDNYYNHDIRDIHSHIIEIPAKMK